jgi:hypothetical protein
MKRFFRNASHEPEDGVPSNDVLDKEVWRRLEAIFAAGYRGDPDDFAGLWLSLEREVTDHQRGLAGVYVWYMLEYRVHDILQRRPTLEDLHEVASRGNAKFAKLIKENETSLEDTLRTVFKFSSAKTQVTGGRLFVAGSAAVSVLLDDPDAQLSAMRAPLAGWYARHAAKLRELGPMAPPRSAP